MASPRWFVVYTYVGTQWKATGQGWEGQGGENIAPVAALDGAPVYVYIWNPDVGRWTSGYFNAQVAAAARPKVIVSVLGDAGVIDTANVDSLLWQQRQAALIGTASQYGFGVQVEQAGASVYPSRNIYGSSGWVSWMQSSMQS